MTGVDLLLDRLRRNDSATSPAAILLDDERSLTRALDCRSDELATVVEASVEQFSGNHVSLEGASFASAAYDYAGSLIAADPGLPEGLDLGGTFDRIISETRNGSSVSVVIDCSGRSVAVAAARWPVAQRWPLSVAVCAALRKHTGSVAIVTFRDGADGWARARRAFGLTSAELRIAQALVRHGDVRRGSASLGIAYETGRKLLAGLLRKTGARRQADAVRALLATIAGETGAGRDLPRLLSDLFGLTERQGKVAIAVANGATRGMAAQQLGISEHAAKKALCVVYDACGVGNSAALARLLAETDVLAGLAEACDVQVEAQMAREPLRLVPRRWAAGLIAVSDHGPAGGIPVIYLHAQMQGRHLPRVTVDAMQVAGLRPIAVERAGFGLSDWVDGDFAQTAARDLLEVFDALALEAPYVMARGGITPLLEVVARHPGRIGGGVLLSPGVPAPHDGPGRNLAGLSKRLLLDRRFVRPFVRALANRTGNNVAIRLHRAIVSGSSADERMLDDLHTCDDLMRAARQAAIGCDGLLHESIAHGNGTQPVPIADGKHWHIMAGAQDAMFDASLTLDYWCTILPGASTTVVPDGGRWLHASHPELVTSALKRLSKTLS